MSVGLLLGLIFITLRLCDVIDWSWVWVLAPIWIECSIVLLIVLLLIVAVLCGSGTVRWNRRGGR